MVVELHIVSDERSVAHVVQEAAQSILMAVQMLATALGEDGVGRIAELLGDGAFGLYVDAEAWCIGHRVAPHLHGGNLDDIVFKHVETGGLRIEHHHLLLRHRVCKVLRIGLAIAAEQV